MNREQWGVAYRHRKDDPTTMLPAYAAAFENEVKRDSFLPGGPWLAVLGAEAPTEILKWHSSLVRGNYRVFGTTVYECICRWRGQFFAGGEDIASQFWNADCYLVNDLFTGVAIHDELSSADKYAFYSFIVNLRASGACLICPIIDEEQEITCFGDDVANIFEELLEVIHAEVAAKETKAIEKTAGRNSGNGGNGGAATAGGNMLRKGRKVVP